MRTASTAKSFRRSLTPQTRCGIAKTDEQLEFAKQWMHNADEIGLPYQIISVEEAVKDEPLLSKDIRFALRTIDTGFDPFRLCIAQAYDAKTKGAVIRTHNEVIGALMDGNRVVGVRVLDKTENRIYEVRAKLVINAAGPWCSQITEMAGFAIPMKPNKGSTGIYSMRPTKTADLASCDTRPTETALSAKAIRTPHCWHLVGRHRRPGHR